MLSLRPKIRVIPKMIRDREGRERLAFLVFAELYGKCRVKVIFADEANSQHLLTAAQNTRKPRKALSAAKTPLYTSFLALFLFQ